MKNRDSFFDVVKGVAILLVILGHSIQFGNGETFYTNCLFYNNIQYKVIYSFHMPLFMLISGYFFYFSNNKYDIVHLIGNKIRTILIPIFSFSLLYFLLTKFSLSDGIMLSIRRYVWTLLSIKIYWFLWAVLSISILLKLVLLLKNRSLIVCSCFALFFVFPLFVDDKIGLYLFFYIYPYFLLGYLANRYSAYAIMQKNKFLFFGGALFCYAVLMMFYTESSFIYTSKISLFQNGSFSMSQLAIDLYRWVVGLFGCIAILSMISILIQYMGVLVNALSKIGVFSLGIYGFQMIVFRVHSLHFIDIITGGGILFLITLLLSFTSTWVVSKTKVLNILFLGGR